MADNSAIEWTEASWNPVTGCTKISAGCQNCYAERMARRLQAMGCARYASGFRVKTHEDALALPLRWKKPRMIFVNSMSDLFHEDVPDSFIFRVFEVMSQACHHTFQILTKRSERLRELGQVLPWPGNVWMGVTVENRCCLPRLDRLRDVPADVRFVSFEPLLEAIAEADLTAIDWAIVGGESGPGARRMSPAWVRSIRDQCVDAGVRFFFKQWGGFDRTRSGRSLDGRIWDEMPILAGAPA